MHEIMRIPLAKTEPLNQIVVNGLVGFLGFLDQTCGRETFAFHEIAIGMRNRSLRKSAQGIVVVEDRRKIGFARAQGFTVGAERERANTRYELSRGERVVDPEDLGGVFLVLQQLAEMSERGQRAIACPGPMRMTQRRTIAGGFKIGNDRAADVHLVVHGCRFLSKTRPTQLEKRAKRHAGVASSIHSRSGMPSSLSIVVRLRLSIRPFAASRALGLAR